LHAIDAPEVRNAVHRLLSPHIGTGERRYRLKRNRAVATRYDKLAVRYEATVHIAAINKWL
jgi:transposase